MSTPPSWLPDVIELADYGGNWDDYVDAIHTAFHDDFYRSQIMFDGTKLTAKKHPEIDGKGATFWHITSSGRTEEERLPDLERCKRVLWPRAIIANSTDASILRWPSSKYRNRTVLWLREHDYMVIIEHRSGYCMLWTAFCVEREHTRQKYQKEYDAYIASQST